MERRRLAGCSLRRAQQPLMVSSGACAHCACNMHKCPRYMFYELSKLRKDSISLMSEQSCVFTVLILRLALMAQSAKLWAHSLKLHAPCRETTSRHGGDAGSC